MAEANFAVKLIREVKIFEKPGFNCYNVGMPKSEQAPTENNYHEFSPGQKMSFKIKSVQPDDSVSSSLEEAKIVDVKGGGFFGRVLILKDKPYVIKTSLPDSWHHFWREVNWGLKPFPAQNSETAAQLEHLSTKLIHRVLPVITGGKFYAPDSLGYTKLSTGYAQLVEKVEGRGPRFDLPKNELKEFRKAQKKLSAVALNLGLEHAGQIHPDNPFGMANLWYDDQNKKWIWMDTIPAIPHNGFVYPFMMFGFHQEIRRWFSSQQPTFNRIHADFFRAELNEARSLFSKEEFKQIEDELILYDKLWKEHETEKAKQKPKLEPALNALADTMTAVAPKIGETIYKTAKKPHEILQMIFDPSHRREFVLRGIREAKSQGLISHDEYEKACSSVKVNGKESAVISGLLAWNFLISRGLDALEWGSYGAAVLGDKKFEMAILGLFAGWILPSIVRSGSAFTLGKATNTDLSTAIRMSLIPKGGGTLGPIAQFANAENSSPLVWHYTVRSLIAFLSSLSPSGGHGTELEGKLWYLIGEKLERFGRPKPKKEVIFDASSARKN